MITEREVQGPGRAYWFDNLKEAAVFAESRKKKGHIVSFCAYNYYVWFSNSWKNHSRRAKLVDAGYDSLAV